VYDGIRPVRCDSFFKPPQIQDIADDQWTPLHGPAIAAGEIVISNDIQVSRAQRLACVAADKSGATSHEYRLLRHSADPVEHPSTDTFSSCPRTMSSTLAHSQKGRSCFCAQASALAQGLTTCGAGS
jgi:hypothetical protein